MCANRRPNDDVYRASDHSSEWKSYKHWMEISELHAPVDFPPGKDTPFVRNEL